MNYKLPPMNGQVTEHYQLFTQLSLLIEAVSVHYRVTGVYPRYLFVSKVSTGKDYTITQSC